MGYKKQLLLTSSKYVFGFFISMPMKTSAPHMRVAVPARSKESGFCYVPFKVISGMPIKKDVPYNRAKVRMR
jgi:hypothetical protein